jgi:hypothetical protein
MQESKKSLELLSSKITAAFVRQDWINAEKLLLECFTNYDYSAKPFWYSNLIQVKRKLAKMHEAELACSEAIRIFPDNPVGYVGRAEIALIKKDWPLSEKLWREVVDYFPDLIKPTWRSNLCLSLFHNGSTDLLENAHKIIDDFSRTKNVNPGLYGNNAIKMAQAQQFSIANFLCKLVQEKFPKSIEVWRSSAVVSNLQKLNKQAAREWHLAASFSQGEPLINFRYQEILSLIKAGKFELVYRKIFNLEIIAPLHNKLILAKLEIKIAEGSFENALNILRDFRADKNILEYISIQRVALICIGANLTVDEAKEFIFNGVDKHENLDQLINFYGQSSSSDSRVFEILQTDDSLWFKDQTKQLIELRRLKKNFLKNRRCSSYTALVRYWLTFAREDELNKMYYLALSIFPESQLRNNLEKLISPSLSKQIQREYKNPWRRFLPSAANSLSSQFNEIPFAKLHCIVVVKDESEILPCFLSHYRKLGINSFVIIDNDPSLEGGVDHDLRHEFNLHVVKAPYSFAQNNHGMNWINEFIDAKKCEWLLFVDADEFMVYPNYEHVNIFQYIKQLEDIDQSAVSAFMLDMYDESYIKTSVPKDDITKHTYFYNEFFFNKDLHPPYRFITGGIRGSGKWTNVLNKVPLIRVNDDIHFTGNHTISHCKLGPNTAVLLHYKLFRDRKLFNQPANDIIKHKRINDRSSGCIARHVSIYSGCSGSQILSIENKSTEYQSSEQLLSMGLLHSADI